MGRIDRQVKIRGFRIELGEIESAQRGHPQVKDVIVQPSGEPGEERLCAYIVGDFDSSELRARLEETLPDYMTPAIFMQIDAMPLTPSGKADRKALPDPEFTAKEASAAPRTEREKLLCSLFAQVLGAGEVGMHDHFFELGGQYSGGIQDQGKSRCRGAGKNSCVSYPPAQQSAYHFQGKQ
jgi:hypothetical protein